MGSFESEPNRVRSLIFLVENMTEEQNWFSKHLDNVSKIVATWPLWKQGILEYSGKSTCEVPRKPVDNSIVKIEQTTIAEPDWKQLQLDFNAKWTQAYNPKLRGTQFTCKACQYVLWSWNESPIRLDDERILSCVACESKKREAAKAPVVNRPNWNDFLLGLARVVSRRSPDSQTKHGCVLADDNHRVLGVGYNGFPRGMKDVGLPTTRPDKYSWMDHSEENAVANCVLRPEGATAYITGKSCFSCLKELWRNGVKKVVQVAGYGWAKDEEESKLRERLIQETGMIVEDLTPDLSWLVDMVLEDKELRAILDQKLAVKA